MNFSDSDTKPILVSAKSAVLLIFTPFDRSDWQQRATITALADLIQQQLGQSVRVLKIEQANHPEVVRSFGIQRLPALVLVQQGVERWRQEGLPDETTLAALRQELALN